MGCYDTVMVPCPHCGTRAGFQSKGGHCLLKSYNLEDAPPDVLSDVNRHSPVICERCGSQFALAIKVFATPVIVPAPEPVVVSTTTITTATTTP